MCYVGAGRILEAIIQLSYSCHSIASHISGTVKQLPREQYNWNRWMVKIESTNTNLIAFKWTNRHNQEFRLLIWYVEAVSKHWTSSTTTTTSSATIIPEAVKDVNQEHGIGSVVLTGPALYTVLVCRPGLDSCLGPASEMSSAAC